MKKAFFTIPALLFTLTLSGCDLFDNADQVAFKHVKNTTWVGEQKTWLPHELYTLEFKDDNVYTLIYHKDAVNTKDVQTPAEDKTLEGKYTFDGKKEYSWTGDWNASHKVIYYIIKIDTHPVYPDGAYITFQLDSNVIYMNRNLPEDKNLGSGQMLVNQNK